MKSIKHFAAIAAVASAPTLSEPIGPMQFCYQGDCWEAPQRSCVEFYPNSAPVEWLRHIIGLSRATVSIWPQRSGGMCWSADEQK